MPEIDDKIGERVASLETKVDIIGDGVRAIMENHLPHLSEQIEKIYGRKDVPPLLGIIIMILSNIVVGFSIFFITK
jgi:hypothetical protein